MITDRLDKVAQVLEEAGRVDLAFQLDLVANSLSDKEAGRFTRTLAGLGVALGMLFASPAKAGDFMSEFSPTDVAGYITHSINAKNVDPQEALKILDQLKGQNGGKEYAQEVLRLLRSPVEASASHQQDQTDTHRRLQRGEDGALTYIFKTKVRPGAGSAEALKAEIDRQVRDACGSGAPESKVRRLVEVAQSGVKPGSSEATYTVPYSLKS